MERPKKNKQFLQTIIIKAETIVTLQGRISQELVTVFRIFR